MSNANMDYQAHVQTLAQGFQILASGRLLLAEPMHALPESTLEMMRDPSSAIAQGVGATRVCSSSSRSSGSACGLDLAAQSHATGSRWCQKGILSSAHGAAEDGVNIGSLYPIATNS